LLLRREDKIFFDRIRQGGAGIEPGVETGVGRVEREVINRTGH
jgi:hypothetical protein